MLAGTSGRQTWMGKDFPFCFECVMDVESQAVLSNLPAVTERITHPGSHPPFHLHLCPSLIFAACGITVPDVLLKHKALPGAFLGEPGVRVSVMGPFSAFATLRKAAGHRVLCVQPPADSQPAPPRNDERIQADATSCQPRGAEPTRGCTMCPHPHAILAPLTVRENSP